jgi:hypothetical protein
VPPCFVLCTAHEIRHKIRRMSSESRWTRGRCHVGADQISYPPPELRLPHGGLLHSFVFLSMPRVSERLQETLLTSSPLPEAFVALPAFCQCINAHGEWGVTSWTMKRWSRELGMSLPNLHNDHRAYWSYVFREWCWWVVSFVIFAGGHIVRYSYRHCAPFPCCFS